MRMKIIFYYVSLIILLTPSLAISSEVRLSKLALQGLELLFSDKTETRIKGSNILSQLEYKELQGFEFNHLGCNVRDDKGDLIKSVTQSKINLKIKSCQSLAPALYHWIGILKKHAQEELNPQSKNFCQNKKQDKASHTTLCPYLSQLRWLVFNQFDDVYSELYILTPQSKQTQAQYSQSPIKKTSQESSPSNDKNKIWIRDWAYLALSEVTTLSPKKIDDLKSFKTLISESSSNIYSYTEILLNDGIYALPTLYFGVWDKKSKSLLKFEKTFPFKKEKENSYQVNTDVLNMRWAKDMYFYPAADPQKEIIALRKDGECCGDKQNYFYFMDAAKKFESLGYITIDSFEFPELQSSTPARLKHILSPKTYFPLKAKKGEFKIERHKYSYEIKSTI